MSLLTAIVGTPVAESGVWQHVETQVLASPAASVSFTGLVPSPFFRLTAYIQNDANVKAVFIRFNNDSAGNYVRQQISASSTSVAGTRDTAQTQIQPDLSPALAASQASSFGFIFAKPSAGVKAQAVGQMGFNASPVLALTGGEWNNTADLISRIDVLASSNNFAAGTSIRLDKKDAS